MKKHWLKIITYIGGVFLLLLVILILEQPFLLLLLPPLIVVPILTTMLFLRASKHISVQASGQMPYVELGNPAVFLIESTNKSSIPLYLCEVKFHAENLFWPNKQIHALSIPVKAKGKSSFEFPVESTIPGMISLTLTELSLSDYLHFFTITKPLSIKVEIPVFPAPAGCPPVSTAPSFHGEEEYIENDLKGAVSSDIKEIREYRPGDRIQRIHWKLSAKMDDLFVKELSHTSVLSMVILPEVTFSDIKETTAVLLELTQRLIKEEERFNLCLYNHATCEFEYLVITDKEENLEALTRFYYLPSYEGKELAREAFFSSSQHASTVIHIAGSKVERIDLETIVR